METERVEGINAGAVESWLVGLDAGLTAPLTFKRIGAGQSNLTYTATDLEGRRLVLRRPPLGELLASAHDVAREHRILTALQGSEVPVVRVFGLATEEPVTDVPLMAVEYVEGLVLNTAADAEQLATEQRHRVGLSLVEAIAKIHSVDLEATGLIDLTSHKPYAERQLRRWSGMWEKSRTRDLPELDRLTQRLIAGAPEPSELTLVHGDCHVRNIIIDPADAEVKAVIDWELCTLGEPLADLGTLLAYWNEPGDPPTVLPNSTARAGFATRAELIEHYARVTGRDVSDHTFWHAIGLWKVAIILEGVRKRQMDDHRNLTSLGEVGPEAVDDLVARANAVLDTAEPVA